MIWKKEVFGGNSIEGLTVIGIVFLIINFYQTSFLLMFLGTFLIIISLMSKYYLHHVGNHLIFENNKDTIKVSVGEEFKLPIKLSQLSRLPIVSSSLRIKLEPIIEGNYTQTVQDDHYFEVTAPIQLKGKDQIQVSIPLSAKKRGVSRIKFFELKINNFFGFGYVLLTYEHFIHKEIIIYPSLITVPQINLLTKSKSNGSFPSKSSMFEEILAPIGTRDYVYSDPFQRIHWKASAKTQTLQTKVYERTADYSWTFLINLRDISLPTFRMSVVENMETIIRNIAYMIQYATVQNIQYEIVLNVNMESGVPVYHLPVATGVAQLSKSYEILARINRERVTQPIPKLLHFVHKQHRKSPVVIVCGPFGEEGDHYFAQMQRNGQSVFILKEDEENPTIVPFAH